MSPSLSGPAVCIYTIIVLMRPATGPELCYCQAILRSARYLTPYLSQRLPATS
jgi:hypothetical protein